MRKAAAGRPDHATLLVDGNGAPWADIDIVDFREITARLGLDHDVTPYALRHSSIVRMLKLAVPIAIVAKHHDTSTAEIERTYSKYILADADAITRAALLDVSAPPAADNIVALRKA